MTDKDEINITADSVILAKPGIVLQEEADNWGILYNPDNDISFGINPVSVFIWKQIKSERTLKELVTTVYENCTDVSAEVEADIVKFIEELLGKGLATLENA
jgi:SynChlorMet cassette protein ScmD